MVFRRFYELETKGRNPQLIHAVVRMLNERGFDARILIQAGETYGFAYCSRKGYEEILRLLERESEIRLSSKPLSLFKEMAFVEDMTRYGK